MIYIVAMFIYSALYGYFRTQHMMLTILRIDCQYIKDLVVTWTQLLLSQNLSGLLLKESLKIKGLK